MQAFTSQATVPRHTLNTSVQFLLWWWLALNCGQMPIQPSHTPPQQDRERKREEAVGQDKDGETT